MKSSCESKCFLCGTKGEVLFEDMDDALWGVPGKWDMLRCTSASCGLLWIDPMPKPADIPMLYRKYQTHSEHKSLPNYARHLYECLRRGMLAASFGYTKIEASRFWRALGRILALHPLLTERIGGTVMWLDGSRKGRLLDVGCGDGKLLARMRAIGWDVVGIEPDEKAAEFARDNHNLDVRTDSLMQAGFADGDFDAITMKHVLEHLTDPIATLRECLRILRPSGRLVLVTPNSASAGLKRYGRDWRGLEPPRHLHLFGPANIRRAVTEAGFMVRTAKSISSRGVTVWLGSDYLRQRRIGTWRNPKDCGLFLRQIKRWVIRLRHVAYVLWQTVLYAIDHNSGEEILVQAIKPSPVESTGDVYDA